MSELRRKPDVDYYKVLQVDPSAEPEVIEASYRALSKKYHPDRNGHPAASGRMAQINMAYDVLRDASKRRDYDQLRNSTRFVATSPVERPATSSTPSSAPFGQERPTTGGVSAGRPAASASRPAATPNNGASSTRTSTSSTGNGASPAASGAASSRNRAKGPAPKVPHSVYVESKGSGWWRWLALFIVLTVAVVGGFFLAKTLVDSTSSTSIISGQPQLSQTGAIDTVGRATASAQANRTQAVIVAGTPTPTYAGPLTLAQVSSYLNNDELYGGRVVENLLLADNSLRLTVRLSKGGRIVNGLENPQPSAGPDDLDTLRQSELTTYNLIYSLFGRFPDLKTIDLRLADPADDKKVIYHATVPRALAYTFSAWRGKMDAKTLSQQDFINAAREDRLLQHLGGPTEDSVRSRLNQPDKNNLRAELISWGLPATLDVSLDSNGALVGYYAVRPEDEKLADYARILYALYTRFPNLDRIQVQDSQPGIPPKFSKASNRVLFNLIGPVDWAELTLDSRPKELLDKLPNVLNVPSLTQNQLGGPEVQVNAGVNQLVKNWQIVNPGTTTRLNQVNTFITSKGQFVLVKVPLKNLSQESQWPLPNAYFSLADAQGRTYQVDPTATMSYVLDVNKIPPGPVEPTKDLEVKLVFDIPINASGLRLIFQDKDSRAILPLSPQQ